MKRNWLSRRGGIKGSTIVWLLVLGAIAYPGYQWFVPQWRYWRILHVLSGKVNDLKVNSVETIRRDTLKIVSEVGMPEGFESALRVEKVDNRFVHVYAEWDDDVMFFGRFPKSFHRVIDREMTLFN